MAHNNNWEAPRELSDIVIFHAQPEIPFGSLAFRVFFVATYHVLGRVLTVEEHDSLQFCIMAALDALQQELEPNQGIMEPMFWSMVLHHWLNMLPGGHALMFNAFGMH